MGMEKVSGAIFGAALLGLSPAYAQSIQTIVSGTIDENSIVMRSCAKCPPIRVRKQTLSYGVKTLPPGTQTVETVKINGEEKIVRTEAWNGGSPVVYVSRAKPGDLMAAEAYQPMPVDPNATTAAVPISKKTPSADAFFGPRYEKPPEALAPGPAKAFDASGLELRLK